MQPGPSLPPTGACALQAPEVPRLRGSLSCPSPALLRSRDEGGCATGWAHAILSVLCTEGQKLAGHQRQLQGSKDRPSGSRGKLKPGGESPGGQRRLWARLGQCPPAGDIRALMDMAGLLPCGGGGAGDAVTGARMVTGARQVVTLWRGGEGQGDWGEGGVWLHRDRSVKGQPWLPEGSGSRRLSWTDVRPASSPEARLGSTVRSTA